MSTVPPLDVMSDTEYASHILSQYSGKELSPDMTIDELFLWNRLQMAAAITAIEWKTQVLLLQGLDRDSLLAMTVQELLEKVVE